MNAVMDIPTRVDNVVLRTADLLRVANLRRRQWTPEAAERLAVEMTKTLRTPYGQMTLKPMQAISLYELATERGGFFPLAVGAGKTLVSLLAPVVLQRAHNVGHRPLLIVPAGLIEKTERDAKMLAEHWQLARFYKIMSYEFLGRVQAGANERTGYKGALEEFAPDFGFLDECFPYRTKVLTDQGEQSIGDVVCLGVGHSVLSRASSGELEWRRIVRRLRRPGRQPLVRVVHEHGAFVCTGNHQIWTESGYVEASALSQRDTLCSLRNPVERTAHVLLDRVLQTRPSQETLRGEDMCVVQEDFPFSIRWAESERQEEILQYVLLSQMANEVSSIKRGGYEADREENIGASERQAAAVAFRADASQQPNSRSSSYREDLSVIEGPNVFVAGRERAANEATAATFREDRLTDRVRDRNRCREGSVPESSALLQSRSCRPVDHVGNRGGRQHTQDPQVALLGSSKDGGARGSRVVSVEVLERRGVERLGGGGGEDPHLFDLEVEGNHNYFAEGVLVSNCHKAKNRRTAGVARRLHRFFNGHPNVIVAAASGTVTIRSLHDYAHILRWCHPPQHVPLPLHWNELEAWARALDERQTEPGDPGALEILCNAEEQEMWKKDRHGAARLAYRRRLVDTPGIVATKASAVGATLIIRGVQPKPSKVIEEGFDILRTWETPDGWPIDDGIGMARHARELAAGFFYVWSPRPPHEWLAARKAWSKYVRDTLKHSRKMDTELQVRQHEHLKEKEKPGSMCEALVEWNKVKDTFEPNTVPVWVCNSVLEFAHDWAKKHRGIIWNEHVCFGERLEKEGGIPYYGRKGRDARGYFIDDHPAEQSLVASIASNKEGRNLQKWSENLVLGWPSSGGICEQTMGRTHRDGQQADEVTFDVVVSCIEHFGAFEQSRRDANYIEASTGSQQKLNLATIDMPETLIGMGSRWTK